MVLSSNAHTLISGLHFTAAPFPALSSGSIQEDLVRIIYRARKTQLLLAGSAANLTPGNGDGGKALRIPPHFLGNISRLLLPPSSFSPLICNEFPNHFLWSRQIFVLFGFSSFPKFIPRSFPHTARSSSLCFAPLTTVCKTPFYQNRKS